MQVRLHPHVVWSSLARTDDHGFLAPCNWSFTSVQMFHTHTHTRLSMMVPKRIDFWCYIHKKWVTGSVGGYIIRICLYIILSKGPTQSQKKTHGRWSHITTTIQHVYSVSTHWQTNTATENGPFIVDSPAKNDDVPAFLVCLTEGKVR